MFLKDVLDNDAFYRILLRLPSRWALTCRRAGHWPIWPNAAPAHCRNNLREKRRAQRHDLQHSSKATPDNIKFLHGGSKRRGTSVLRRHSASDASGRRGPEKASQVLRRSEEMERRYQIISELGVKSIDAYKRNHHHRGKPERRPRSRNGAPARQGPAEDSAESNTPFQHVTLPTLVIVIDAGWTWN